MRKRLFTYLVVAAALAFGSNSAQAQSENSAGTAGAAYLLIPGTARNAALGTTTTAGLTDMSGLEALYMNPAGLVSNPGTGVMFSRMNYVADIGVNTFGVAQRLGSNQIALTVGSWDFGDIPRQEESAPEITNLTWDASAIQIGLTYARQFTDRIAAGVTVKALNERIDDMNANGVVFDAGMNYTVGETGLRFGVSLKNFGTQMTYSGDGLIREIRLPEQSPDATSSPVVVEAAGYELPSMLNFGVSYTSNFSREAAATILANFQSNSLERDVYSTGLELSLRNILFVRGGYSYQQDMDQNMFEGWNLGGGLQLDLSGNRLAVDYAYRPTQYFGNVQMITASFSLK